MKPAAISHVYRSGVGLFSMSVVLIFLLSAESLFAQGIDRESLAGEAAENGMKGSDTNLPYNINIGPVAVRATASIFGTYNDNINTAQSGKISDYIIEPQIDLDGRWQVTDLNALLLDVGIGYQDYVSHPSASGLTVTPNSRLVFNIFVGDFKINLHDSFSYQQDPIGVGQVSGVTQFSRFSNDAGVQVDWDLGDLIASLGYDHDNYIVFGSFKYLDSQTDVLTPSLTFKLSPTLSAGLSGSAGRTTFDQDIQNNNYSVSGGPFVTATLTENLAVHASGGWIYTDYDHGGGNGDTSNVNSFYAQGGISHRVNDVISQSATIGEEYLPGVTSNYTQRTYARYDISWKATDYISTSLFLFYEHLKDSDATFQETSDRYGLGGSVNYNVTEHMTLNASYQYVDKDSDQSTYSYIQNTLSLGANYRF